MKAIISVSAACVAKWQIPHADLKTGCSKPNLGGWRSSHRRCCGHCGRCSHRGSCGLTKSCSEKEQHTIPVAEHSVHHHSQRHGTRRRSLLKCVEISGATSSVTCTSSIPRYVMFMLEKMTSESSLTAKKACMWESFHAVLQCILTAFLHTET